MKDFSLKSSRFVRYGEQIVTESFMEVEIYSLTHDTSEEGV